MGALIMNIKKALLILFLPALFVSTTFTNNSSTEISPVPVNIHVHTGEKSSWLPSFSFKNIVVSSIVVGGGYYMYQQYKKNNELARRLKNLQKQLKTVEEKVSSNGIKLNFIGSFLMHVHASHVPTFTTVYNSTQKHIETLFKPIEKSAQQLRDQSSSWFSSLRSWV